MIRLPPKSITWTTLRTTTLVWLVLRVLVGVVSGSPNILLPASIFLMLGVAATAVVDVIASRERILLGNLGVGRGSIAGVSLAASGTLEVLAALAFRVLGAGG